MHGIDHPIGHAAGVADTLKVALKIGLVGLAVPLKRMSQDKSGCRIFRADAQRVAVEKMDCVCRIVSAGVIGSSPPGRHALFPPELLSDPLQRSKRVFVYGPLADPANEVNARASLHVSPLFARTGVRSTRRRSRYQRDSPFRGV